MPVVRHSVDRRRQPQTVIKAVGEVLQKISMPVKEITSQRFLLPDGSLVNESYGYELKVPEKLPFLDVRVGFVSHRKVRPGIYIGLTPDMSRDQEERALRNGYRISEFGKYLLIKQIMPQEQIIRLEENFGTRELKKRVGAILKKNYPFCSIGKYKISH